MKKTKTFSIDEEVYKKLGILCQEMKLTRSFVCDMLLTNFVNLMEEYDYEEKYIYISRFLLQSFDPPKKIEREASSTGI